MSSNPQVRREELYNLLGDLPPRDRPISSQLISTQEQDGYILEKLMLDLNGFESVPAYFAKPKNGKAKFPCVIYNHAHGGDYVLGKDELTAGRDALQKPPYARVLTELGYSALCIDTWNFGERRGMSETELFKLTLWRGQVLWGLMVYDGLRSFDYLLSRDDVVAERIATVGISMGSTMAWWMAALEPRIKVCIDICCLTDFEELIASRGLDGHGVYYYVPGLLKHFTTAEINALIAPRAHLSLAGNHDLLTPPRGLDKVDAELKKVYENLGAPDAWRLERYDIGHFESAMMRSQIISFLQECMER
jgi:hypothetical protein